jgi:hypothetical protein
MNGFLLAEVAGKYILAGQGDKRSGKRIALGFP